LAQNHFGAGWYFSTLSEVGVHNYLANRRAVPRVYAMSRGPGFDRYRFRANRFDSDPNRIRQVASAPVDQHLLIVHRKAGRFGAKSNQARW
jgi:hypothetical protein